MIAQLSCLIFGYIRHTKPYQENERPPYINYFDPIVEYYTLKYSQVCQQEQDQKEQDKGEEIKINSSILYFSCLLALIL